MKHVSTTKMSSKKQIVTLKDMREDIKEDLEFSRKTQKSYKRYGKGEFTKMKADNFIKMLNKIKRVR